MSGIGPQEGDTLNEQLQYSLLHDPNRLWLRKMPRNHPEAVLIISSISIRREDLPILREAVRNMFGQEQWPDPTICGPDGHWNAPGAASCYCGALVFSDNGIKLRRSTHSFE